MTSSVVSVEIKISVTLTSGVKVWLLFPVAVVFVVSLWYGVVELVVDLCEVEEVIGMVEVNVEDDVDKLLLCGVDVDVLLLGEGVEVLAFLLTLFMVFLLSLCTLYMSVSSAFLLTLCLVFLLFLSLVYGLYMSVCEEL